MEMMTKRMSMAATLAAALGSLAYLPAFRQPNVPKQRKPAPSMVTASPEEIAAWNSAVDARNAARKRPSGKFNFNVKGTGQHPKFPKERARKQHSHPLRDEHGAYTLVGNNPFKPRRKWLGGISAQRGY
jgi:opacity protein-like surface antigen